jgi:luciferase family oxidoreductase group 1
VKTLGYHRFWVSEHHSHPSIVGTSPEILLAHLAANTKRIRLGSAGVMLPHYSALKVAEQFRVLDALAPGRIDLGVGRAPGSDSRTAMLLNPDPRSSEYFPRQIQELQCWLNNEDFPVGHPGRGVHAYPLGETSPDVWILGSSNYGAQVAAHFGLPYVFAHFITDGVGAEEALEIYYSQFTPSKYLERPQALLCVWSLTAATQEDAIFSFRSRARSKIDRQRGILGPMIKPTEALIGLSTEDLKTFDRMCERAFIGDFEQVTDKLNRLCQSLDIEEVAIITWAYDFQTRLDSYRYLAIANHVHHQPDELV